MKASWMAAVALSASMVGGARADLTAHVYNGWQVDLSGKISAVGLDHVGTFIDPQIDHWNGDIGYRWNPLGVDELYTVLWDGYLLAPTSGLYEFRTVSDDGVQVFLGGQTVIDSPILQWYGESLGSATLTAGAHALDVRFFENFTYDGIVLQWKKPGDADWSVIPSSALLTSVPEPESVAMVLAGLAAMGGLVARCNKPA